MKMEGSPESLLLALASQDEIMGFENFTGEVSAVSEQLLEVDAGIFVQKHTGDSWSKFVTKGGLNEPIDAISNKFVPLLALQRVKWGYINGAQLDQLHLLLCNWLLLHLHWLLIHLTCACDRRLWHSHCSGLWFVVIKLLLLLRSTLLLLLILVVLHTSSCLASSTLLATASTPRVLFVSSVIICRILLCVALVLLHWLHSLHLLAVEVPVLILLNIDQLKDVVN